MLTNRLPLRAKRLRHLGAFQDYQVLAVPPLRVIRPVVAPRYHVSSVNDREFVMQQPCLLLDFHRHTRGLELGNHRRLSLTCAFQLVELQRHVYTASLSRQQCVNDLGVRDAIHRRVDARLSLI
jgi:hypothetical protein